LFNGWMAHHALAHEAASNRSRSGRSRVKVSSFAEAQAAAKNRIAAICKEVDLKAPCVKALEGSIEREPNIITSGDENGCTPREYLQIDEGHSSSKIRFPTNAG
jgi:hypothetical protein